MLNNPNQPASRAGALGVVAVSGAFFAAGWLLDGWARVAWLAFAALMLAASGREAARWIRASPAERLAMRAAELERRKERLGARYREPTVRDRIGIVILTSLLGGFFGFILCGIGLGQLLRVPLHPWYPLAWLALWAVATALGIRGAIKFEP